MKHLHRQTLRLLPGPFLGWLGTLMFLLLMQFLIKYLPDIVGRGLPLGLIVELVAYNLAYMVVLAVPMSVLIAALMSFGRLAETNAYLVIKSAGISLPQLIWPALVAGLCMTGGMWYFNNYVLPEANFRAKNLWQDIRSKKPGFELQPGVFYDGLNGYSILVQELPVGTNELVDVLIYDYTEGAGRQTVIKAARGELRPVGGTALDLHLTDGEVHRKPELKASHERYEHLAFERLRLRLDLSDFAFERSDPREGSRSDRTMPTDEMVALVDSLDAAATTRQAALRTHMDRLLADTVHVAVDAVSLPAPSSRDDLPGRRIALTGLPFEDRQRVYDRALQSVQVTQSEIGDAVRTMGYEMQQADRYRVEIHKKRSIAIACLIFMLIGAPLGLRIRRGGLGTAGALALGIFLFYWVTLVQGEKLADRGFLPPWIGMWIANLVVTVAGLTLLLSMTFDLGFPPRIRRPFARLFRGRTST